MPARPRRSGQHQHNFNSSHHSSSVVDSLISRQNDLDAVARGVARGDLVIYANFTDDEDENNPPNYISGSYLNGLSDEDVVTRTGEASRLRRRGALHGRRHQYTYTTLSCGVELPWRFRFEAGDSLEECSSKSTSLFSTTSEFQRNGSVRTGKLPLDFPSTGCNTTLTNCAFVAPHQNVYTAYDSTDIVTSVDTSYMDEKQEEMVKELLSNFSSCCEWKPVACRQCGIVVGLQYWQTFQDENGNPLEDTYGRVSVSRFAFFPSTVTSSKPYNFTEGKFSSEPSPGRHSSSTPVAANPPSRRRSVDFRRPEVQHQISPVMGPPDRPESIQVRLPLTSRSENHNYSSSSIQRLSSENILPSIPESSLSASVRARREEHMDSTSWSAWMPDPYIYASDGEDWEAIERELEQRRLRLSEAISILQTTNEGFATHEYSDEPMEEGEPPAVSAMEDPQQSSAISANPDSGSLDEPTQVTNPHPYTHLSSSAPVPPSISTRTREANRVDGQNDDEASQLASGYIPSTTLNPHPSDETHPLPIHLPVSYDSPASISDIEASNQDTGEVESIGILVEVEPPPPNVTSSFGSAVVVPSLVDPNEHIQRHTLDYIHVTPPADCISSPDQEENSGSTGAVEPETSTVREPEDQYTDLDTKTDNLFNINGPRNSPDAVSEVYTFDVQSINLTPYREYTPSLPPLSPGALATPSLPYSPTTSVPLPPTLLPLMEILDSIDMEVLPVARYSDLDDSISNSGSEPSDDVESRSEEEEEEEEEEENQNQNPYDEFVYTTELPWDRSDSDSHQQWMSYEESPIEYQLPWSVNSIESVFPFSADESVPAEVRDP